MNLLRSFCLLMLALEAEEYMLAKDVRIVPTWTVQVLDTAGQPVAGVTVDEDWAFSGIEPRNEGKASLKTNAEGRVVFSAQRFQVTESHYLSEKATTMLNVHGSFGPTGSVSINLPGYKYTESSYATEVYDRLGAKTTQTNDALATVIKLIPLDLLDYIERKDWEKVKAMVLADPRLTKFRSHEGDTPLMRLALFEEFAGPVVEIVRLLEANGADMNAKDSVGGTALHFAANHCDSVWLEFLLSHGTDPNQRIETSDNYHGGYTALDCVLNAYELRNGRGSIPDAQKAACIELLLAHGANLNGRSGKGNTPLHVAMDYCGPDTIRLLLLRGADPLAKNSAGKTPLDSIAVYRDDPRLHQIRELLVQAAARKQTAPR